MKRGDIVCLKNKTGEIELVRYHSKYSKESFNIFLHFDMSTEEYFLRSKKNILFTACMDNKKV